MRGASAASIAGSAAARSRQNPLWEIGGGPWLVLEDCPAETHNTLNRARRIHRAGVTRAACVCPRAHKLLSGYGNRQRNRSRVRDRIIAGWKEIIAAAPPFVRVPISRAPDMRGVACSTPNAMKVMDIALTANGRSAATLQARAICAPCPIRNECGSWALTAGRGEAFDGIFGGMTKRERDAFIEREMYEKQAKRVMANVES